MKHFFAICLNNAEYPVSLVLHKVYPVIPDEDAEQEGDLRIIDESGEDYLYPASYFMQMMLPEEMEQQLTNSFARGLEPA